MNITTRTACNCTACPGAQCTCGCQQPGTTQGTPAAACACGPACRCGNQCRCTAK